MDLSNDQYSGILETLDSLQHCFQGYELQPQPGLLPHLTGGVMVGWAGCTVMCICTASKWGGHGGWLGCVMLRA